MSWKIISKFKNRLGAESGLSCSSRGGALRICLVYPNRYAIAMSNLGFQAVYAMLNGYPQIVCERAFLPDKDEMAEYEVSRTPLLSLETQQPVSGFDIIAYSISFESDYLNIPVLFRLAGIPPLADERTEKHPLVIAGGAATFINPEPIADFIDAVCIGEAEVILPELLEKLCAASSGRDELLGTLDSISGVYLPSLLPKKQVARAYLKDLDLHPVTTVINAPESEFSDMHLVELTRGCPRGCRFCAAGFIYHPYRQRTFESVKSDIDKGIALGRKIGLVAAAVGDFKGVDKLCRYIVDSGGTFSVSSLRIDGLDETMTSLLVESGHKTATLAPEGGSQRLRDLVKKGISEEQILAACERLIEKDILNLKLYFIIGLPTETDDDVLELLQLVEKIRELVLAKAKLNRRIGEITLSINPFIPKPFTPFQWCGMMRLKVLEKRLATIQNHFRRVANVSVQAESLKEAMLQALLSRGDRSLSEFLLMSDELGSWKRGAKAVGIDIEKAVTRQIPLDEELPWG
ncbi:MAG: radical SAM protein, partial [Geobacteraceae bacterium]|nr:radical SAM protein [Geobacteraceae bacterium]